MKQSALSILTLLFGLGIMSGSFAQRTASAARRDVVPSLQVNNTQNLNGKYVHAVYAIQRAGFIGVTPAPYLERIRTIQSQKVQTNSVVFPSVTIDKEPFRGSYNIVVVVVSSQATIRWVNPDQAVQPQYQYLTKIEKPVFDLFLNQQGEAAIFGISL